MTVYELRKELEKYPQNNKVIFCVATEVAHVDGYRGGDHWFEELQESDLRVESGALVLAR